MPKSLSDLLAETESLLDVREAREQLKAGTLRPEDVEEMAPETPWRDFLTEMLDPTLYATAGGAGAIHAARFGKPIMKTALEWADPFVGIPKLVGSWFGKTAPTAAAKWPVGATTGGATRPRPGPTMGTKLGQQPIEQPTERWLTEGYIPRELPATVPKRTMGEMFSVERRVQPRAGIPERAGGRPMGEGALVPEVVEEQRRLLTSGSIPGELSADVVNITNTFSKGLKEPIDELTEAAEKVLRRSKLVQDAERLLKTKVKETPSEARTHTARMAAQMRIFREEEKKPKSVGAAAFEGTKKKVPFIELKKSGKHRSEYVISEDGWRELKKTPYAAKMRQASTRETLGGPQLEKDLFYINGSPTVIPKDAGFTTKDLLKVLTTSEGPKSVGAAVGEGLTVDALERPQLRALASTIWKSEGKSGIQELTKLFEEGKITEGQIGHNISNEFIKFAHDEAGDIEAEGWLPAFEVANKKAMKLFEQIKKIIGTK